MNTIKTANIGKRIVALLLLIVAGYQLWLVADRWVAALKYRLHFGHDSGVWVSLGYDTVLIGFASLLFVCIISHWTYRKSTANKDVLGGRISMAAFGLAATAFSALLILVLLPTTAFR